MWRVRWGGGGGGCVVRTPYIPHPTNCRAPLICTSKKTGLPVAVYSLYFPVYVPVFELALLFAFFVLNLSNMPYVFSNFFR